MSNRKSSKGSGSSRKSSASPSRAPSRSPTQPSKTPAGQNRGSTNVVIVQPRQGPGMFGTVVGSAVGAAAGTVIGDKITGRSEDTAPAQDSITPEGIGPCQPQQQQFLNCAQNQSDIQYESSSQSSAATDQDCSTVTASSLWNTKGHRSQIFAATKCSRYSSWGGSWLCSGETTWGSQGSGMTIRRKFLFHSFQGHVIGNALTHATNHGHSTAAMPPLESSNTVEGVCTSEIRHFFECAFRSEDLDSCKALHQVWLACQNEQSLNP
ncbi:uncharacterized protein LOC105700965 isoform X1 [Orussus abietinus]|uniref:uncharacterized protein LOC105700965 isoform X1 n=1 Tax=Orussus abietinus TaxID=222816 RepID=UPI000C716106|nr:uncharacterized protein LOC105700965 isoform X1 [Orussus abietinus]XP_023290490.1 uncharacterized protein LOC105700965 isoform X1 [Orussus abietinus]